MATAKALHIINTDKTNEMKKTHKLLDLVCNSIIMRSYSTIPRITMSDIKEHSYWLGVQCKEKFTTDFFIKTSLNNIICMDSLQGCCQNFTKRKARLTCCLLILLDSNEIIAGYFKEASQVCCGKWSCHQRFSQSIFIFKPRSMDVLNVINEVMKALVAPVRPLGSVFWHFGGLSKCIQGHYQFFETDQNCVTGTMNNFIEQNVNNVFVMIHVITTPKQKLSFLPKQL